MVKDLICSNTYYKALAAAPLLKVRIPKTGPPERFQIKWELDYVCLFVYLGVRILLLDAVQEMIKDLICSHTYYKALAAALLLKVCIPKTGPVDCFQII